MSFKRVLRFIALMVFILVVVVLLARNSIMELRARAEESFFIERIGELVKAVETDAKTRYPLYHIEADPESGDLKEAAYPEDVRGVLDLLTSGSGRFRRGDHFWVYRASPGGGYILSKTPYGEVISWTKGFEAKEIRNVVLVMFAFGIFTLVWMWADRRALIAEQKAKMVDQLESMVKERSEALDRMNRQARLGEFAASLAHEIRNPLGSVVTSARLLPDATEDEVHDLVGVISRESARLDHILADFLSFSRDPKPNIRRVVLNSLIEQTIVGLKRSQQFRDVKVDYDFDPDLKRIPCDPEQMEQVFWNIALNGAQSMENGGNLFITTRLSGPWAEISFRDEGRGVDSEKKERVFEPFFTDKRDGTGLGLSIASRIVEAHEGFIRIRSQINSGTTFIVSIPVNREK